MISFKILVFAALVAVALSHHIHHGGLVQAVHSHHHEARSNGEVGLVRVDSSVTGEGNEEGSGSEVNYDSDGDSGEERGRRRVVISSRGSSGNDNSGVSGKAVRVRVNGFGNLKRKALYSIGFLGQGIKGDHRASSIFRHLSTRPKATSVEDVLNVYLTGAFGAGEIIDSWVPGLGKLFSSVAVASAKINFCLGDGSAIVRSNRPGTICSNKYGSNWGFKSEREISTYNSAKDYIIAYGLDDGLAKFKRLLNTHAKVDLSSLSGSQRVVAQAIFDLFQNGRFSNNYSWSKKDVSFVFSKVITVLAALGSSYHRNVGPIVVDDLCDYSNLIGNDNNGLKLSALKDEIKKSIVNANSNRWQNVIKQCSDDDFRKIIQDHGDDDSEESSSGPNTLPQRKRKPNTPKVNENDETVDDSDRADDDYDGTDDINDEKDVNNNHQVTVNNEKKKDNVDRGNNEDKKNINIDDGDIDKKKKVDDDDDDDDDKDTRKRNANSDKKDNKKKKDDTQSGSPKKTTTKDTEKTKNPEVKNPTEKPLLSFSIFWRGIKGDHSASKIFRSLSKKSKPTKVGDVLDVYLTGAFGAGAIIDSWAPGLGKLFSSLAVVSTKINYCSKNGLFKLPSSRLGSICTDKYGSKWGFKPIRQISTSNKPSDYIRAYGLDDGLDKFRTLLKTHVKADLSSLSGSQKIVAQAIYDSLQNGRFNADYSWSKKDVSFVFSKVITVLAALGSSYHKNVGPTIIDNLCDYSRDIGNDSNGLELISLKNDIKKAIVSANSHRWQQVIKACSDDQYKEIVQNQDKNDDDDDDDESENSTRGQEGSDSTRDDDNDNRGDGSDSEDYKNINNGNNKQNKDDKKGTNDDDSTTENKKNNANGIDKKKDVKNYNGSNEQYKGDKKGTNDDDSTSENKKNNANGIDKKKDVKKDNGSNEQYKGDKKGTNDDDSTSENKKNNANGIDKKKDVKNDNENNKQNKGDKKGTNDDDSTKENKKNNVNGIDKQKDVKNDNGSNEQYKGDKKGTNDDDSTSENKKNNANGIDKKKDVKNDNDNNKQNKGDKKGTNNDDSNSENKKNHANGNDKKKDVKNDKKDNNQQKKDDKDDIDKNSPVDKDTTDKKVTPENKKPTDRKDKRKPLYSFSIFWNGIKKDHGASSIFKSLSKKPKPTKVGDVLDVYLTGAFGAGAIIDSWAPGLGKLFSSLAVVSAKINYCSNNGLFKVSSSRLGSICTDKYGSNWGFKPDREVPTSNKPRDYIIAYGLDDGLDKFRTLLKTHVKADLSSLSGSQKIVAQAIYDTLQNGRFNADYSWSKQDVSFVFSKVITVLAALGSSYHKNVGSTIVDNLCDYSSDIGSVSNGLDLSSLKNEIKNAIVSANSHRWQQVIKDCSDDQYKEIIQNQDKYGDDSDENDDDDSTQKELGRDDDNDKTQQDKRDGNDKRKDVKKNKPNNKQNKSNKESTDKDSSKNDVNDDYSKNLGKNNNDAEGNDKKKDGTKDKGNNKQNKGDKENSNKDSSKNDVNDDYSKNLGKNNNNEEGNDKKKDGTKDKGNNKRNKGDKENANKDSSKNDVNDDTDDDYNKNLGKNNNDAEGNDKKKDGKKDKGNNKQNKGDKENANKDSSKIDVNDDTDDDYNKNSGKNNNDAEGNDKKKDGTKYKGNNKQNKGDKENANKDSSKNDVNDDTDDDYSKNLGKNNNDTEGNDKKKDGKKDNGNNKPNTSVDNDTIEKKVKPGNNKEKSDSKTTKDNKGALSSFGIFWPRIKGGHRASAIFKTLSTKRKSSQVSDVLDVYLTGTFGAGAIIDSWVPGLGKLFSSLVLASTKINYCLKNSVFRDISSKLGSICSNKYGSDWGFKVEIDISSYDDASDYITAYGVNDGLATFKRLLKTHTKSDLSGLVGSQKVVAEAIRDFFDNGRFSTDYSWTKKDVTFVFSKVITVLGALGSSYNSKFGPSLVDELLDYSSDIGNDSNGLVLIDLRQKIKKSIATCQSHSWNDVIIFNSDEKYNTRNDEKTDEITKHTEKTKGTKINKNISDKGNSDNNDTGNNGGKEDDKKDEENQKSGDSNDDYKETNINGNDKNEKKNKNVEEQKTKHSESDKKNYRTSLGRKQSVGSPDDDDDSQNGRDVESNKDTGNDSRGRDFNDSEETSDTASEQSPKRRSSFYKQSSQMKAESDSQDGSAYSRLYNKNGSEKSVSGSQGHRQHIQSENEAYESDTQNENGSGIYENKKSSKNASNEDSFKNERKSVKKEDGSDFQEEASSYSSHSSSSSSSSASEKSYY